MLFGSKKKAQDGLSRGQALAARPVQLVRGKFVPIPDGGAKLTVTLKPAAWSNWLFRLPEGASKTFELDELGVFIWQSCDGKTSVQQMIRRLAQQRRLTLREEEVATLQFLQTLIRKGLIGVPVEKQKAGK
jgi:hypothetical protein